jgi:flagellar basal body rod protein FlgG
VDALTIAAASGLRSRMESLDLLANNLANSATSGFKRDQESYNLYASNLADDTVEGSQGFTLPVIERQWTDFSQGPLQVTGNPMDVAISGSGLLAVTGPSGPLYTRGGSLQLLPSGQLATSEGYPLRDPNGAAIQVAGGKPFEISTGGQVTQEGQTVGQISLVGFKSTDALQKVGADCFRNTDTNNLPSPASDAQLQQGKLEASNVPVAESAMRLVGVMRQFEMLQKAVGISSEMDSKSIQEVARV